MSERPTAACGLCREVRPLCRSHLLPRAFYRLLRGNGAENPNPNPHFLTREFDQQIPSQAADYLLCDVCEQMFRRNGEDWVLRHCYRGHGIFRLHPYSGECTACGQNRYDVRIRDCPDTGNKRGRIGLLRCECLLASSRSELAHPATAHYGYKSGS